MPYFVLNQVYDSFDKGSIFFRDSSYGMDYYSLFVGTGGTVGYHFIPPHFLGDLVLDSAHQYLMSNGQATGLFYYSSDSRLVFTENGHYFKVGEPVEVNAHSGLEPTGLYLVKEVFPEEHAKNMSEGDWVEGGSLYLGEHDHRHLVLSSLYGGEVLSYRREKLVGFHKSETPYEFTKPLTDWGVTKEHLSSFYDGQYSNWTALYSFLSNKVGGEFHKIIIFCYQPKQSSKFPGMISVIKSKSDLDRDRHTALRPGKAFKLMFPKLSSVEVEELVRKYNKQFPILNFTLKSSKEAKDFKHAYTHDQSVNQDPRTNQCRKSMQNSCMRYGYEDFPCHPSEVYASGDFTIFWTEDGEGNIGSRCVVYTPEGGKPVAGPVYGNTEQAIDLIEEKIKEMGGYLFDNSPNGWEGAHIRVVEYGNGFIVPYIDDSARGCVDMGDGLFKLTEGRCDFEACEPDGVVYPNGQYSCDACGCDLDEDETRSGVDGEGCYCDHCWDSNFFNCALSGETAHRDEGVTVFIPPIYRWQGDFLEVMISSVEFEAGDFHEFEEEYYDRHLLTFDTYDNEPVPKHLVGTEYFTCDATDIVYPVDQSCQLNGMKVSKDWIEAQDPATIEHVEGNIYHTKKEEAA